MNQFQPKIYFVLCLAISLFASPAFASTQKELISDMRILIDVSGSMKQNDPNNLRSPALKLLVGLLPNKSRAGVWTFGQQVNMQVKLGDVNDAWKKYARNEAKNIHSYGLFTNIEDALIRATFDWKKPDPDYQRTLILLTDGMVDISKDPALNRKSRDRILSIILPNLNGANVKIHTIALSKNADAELLKMLASRTNGWYSNVTSAKDLKKKFLHLFEKSTQADTIPFKGNAFTVDKSVSEMTVLIFRAEDSSPTELLTPEGQSLTHDSMVKGMQWHHETGYDMITIKSPEPGKWKAKADIDPDNRVLVITNLKLKSNRFSHNFLKGDIIPIYTDLEDKKKIIKKKGFLDLVTFELLINDKDSEYKLSDDGKAPDAKPGDGIFSSIIETDDLGESNEVLIQAKSATFSRQLRHSFKVFSSPMSVSISERKTDDDQPFSLKITVRPYIFVKGSVSVHLDLPDGKTLTPDLSINQQWIVDIPATYQGNNIHINLSGKRYSHSEPYEYSESLQIPLLAAPKPLIVEEPKEPLAPPVKKEPVKEKPVVSEKIEKEVTPPQKDKEEPAVEKEAVEPEAPEEHEDNWFAVFMFVLIGNVVIFSGVVYGYFFWKKKRDAVLEEDNAVFEDEGTENKEPEKVASTDEETEDKGNTEEAKAPSEEASAEIDLSEDEAILKQQIELEDDDDEELDETPVDEPTDEPGSESDSTSNTETVTEEPDQAADTDGEKNTDEEPEVGTADEPDASSDADSTAESESISDEEALLADLDIDIDVDVAADESESVEKEEIVLDEEKTNEKDPASSTETITEEPDQTEETDSEKNTEEELEIEETNDVGESDKSSDTSSATESEPVNNEEDLLDDPAMDAPADKDESAEKEEIVPDKDEKS